ncbi:MAG: hypothetical protein H7A06_05435 [Pseudomonadales bacterium]|nr:hypothetical protein [Pseudomonadales bacterium]
MTHFLHLQEWLSSTEALSYLKLNEIDVPLRVLLKAYTTLEFELRIDFKNPTTYALKLETGTTYPHSLFRHEFTDRENLRHQNGELIKLFYPEELSRIGHQRGYAEDSAVWIHSSLDDESFSDDSYQNFPVYLKNTENWNPDYLLDFVILTWRNILSENPNLLLFNRSKLEQLVVYEKSAQARELNQVSNRNSAGRLATKERNTLLIMIAALCRNSKIDYKQRGVAIAIQQMTENIGAPVTDDTIKRVLDQIDSALDSRGK